MDETEERYVKLVEVERHMESRALTSHGQYLTANTFMLAGWAVLFNGPLAADKSVCHSGVDLVLVLIPILGYIWGLMWSQLSARNWRYCRMLVARLHECGRDIKGDSGPDGKSLYRILARTEETIRGGGKSKFRFSSHPTLLMAVPLSVALLYVALGVVWGWSRGQCGWFNPWVPCAVGGLATLFLVGVGVWLVCKELAVEKVVEEEKGKSGYVLKDA